jgi:hypothetical protein
MGMDVQHGALCEAAERFVRGLHRKVGSALHCGRGEGGVQAEVRAMRLIHYQRNAPLVAHLHACLACKLATCSIALFVQAWYDRIETMCKHGVTEFLCRCRGRGMQLYSSQCASTHTCSTFNTGGQTAELQPKIAKFCPLQ